MPDSLFISKLKMPNNNEYLIKDAALTARVDALETASLEVKIYDTLPAASAETMHYLALVADSSAPGDYVEYVTVKTGSSAPYTYTWEKIGTTSTDLTDYLKASEVTTATGTVTVTSENHSHTYKEATGITNTAASADVTINSFNYTPSGIATIEVVEGATFNTDTGDYESTPTATPTFSSVSASVTGASYTPAGTVTASVTGGSTGSALADIVVTDTQFVSDNVSITDDGHVHGKGTLAGTVGTGITLTSSTATSTGAIKYLDGASWTANTPTAVTLPTRSSTSVVASYSYDSATETLEFVSSDIWQMATAGSVTAGTAATFSPSTKYFTAALTNGAVTITGSVSNATTGITGTYSKFDGITIVDQGHTHSFDLSTITVSASFSGTAATITPTVSYQKVSSISLSNLGHRHNIGSGDVVTVISAAFSGTQSTITGVTGTAAYSKATSLTFNNAATTGSAAAAKASTYNVAGGSVVTINHAAS